MFFPATARPILVLGCLLPATWATAQESVAKNRFANPGFEFGSSGWQVQKGGKTDARFAADGTCAHTGGHSALVTIGDVEEWGAQFGQSVDAGSKGETYTFAVLAKSVAKPVVVTLQIERGAKPWDRVAKSRSFTLTKGDWAELHVTFTVDKPFPQGWFAYVSCTEPNSQFRVDTFRLYQGDYVPYEEAQRSRATDVEVRLFDTRVSSSAPFAADVFAKRARWTKVPEDETDHSFEGDAVFTNDRIAVALRGGAPGAEVYSKGEAGPILRAVLAPAAEGPEVRLTGTAIVDNTPGVVAVDATFTTAEAKTFVLRYELEMGQVFVTTEARGGTGALHVRAPSRFVVLPDFFADDLVVDATEIPVDQADLPSENFLLWMLPDRQAMVMSVSSSRAGDARINVSGEGEDRWIDGCRLRYGDQGKIWVAVIAAPDVWTVHQVAPDDAGREIRLDWTAPYPAQWRVDWRRDDRLTGSWEMVIEKPNGSFEKHGWFGRPVALATDRKRWTTVLGWFEYPCWLDQEGRGHLQPFKKRIRFRGPAVVYPINRVAATPLSAYTVVDVMRATLGVGPCEYILDVEGQGSAMKGRATCAMRDALNPIYAAGRQRHNRETIERALDEVLVFVTHIRGRIDAYVDFGHALVDYLDQEKQAHPELADFCTEMETLARVIDQRFEAREEKIRTPRYVADLTERFRDTLLDYEGPDASEKCKEITGAIVVVGGNQDELVGECRMAVKVLRQRAGLAMAVDPRVATIATEIRRRTQQVLRNAASYEAPRH